MLRREAWQPQPTLAGSQRGRSTLRLLDIAVALVAVAGCNRPPSAEFTTTNGLHSSSTSSSSRTTNAGSSSAASTVATTEASTATDDSAATSYTPPKDDVGWETDLDDGKPPGCKGKIDFVFVISGLSLLIDLQPRLIDAFPKFIETIEEKFDDFDYHIMVVEDNDLWGSGACTQLCETPGCKHEDPCCLWPWASEEGEPCCPDLEYPCDSLDLVTACDATMGAGTVFPAGANSSNKHCKIAGGRRYMTNEQPNLTETFACAAQVGTWGRNRVADGMIASLAPGINGPGGCNEGFLRDDALLMITMLSTTVDDSKTLIYPWEWYDAVVEAKGGDASSVIAFLIGNAKCPFPEDYSCQFAKMFTHHVIIDHFEPDYSTGFDAATDLVELACEDFIPQ